MIDFTITELRDSSVLELFDLRDKIQIDPDYQRPGNVWSLGNKQLFIDSLLNGYDIPKLYFHALVGQFELEGLKFAIVDGRQRLETIWDFFDGRFPLAEDFEYLRNEDVNVRNMAYSQISDEYPSILSRLHARHLSVTVINTDDRDLIEDMFSRLNEAAPLNAAERRNAFGGPLPGIIRELANHPFFVEKVRVPSTRYRHYDLVTKLLFIETQAGFPDTKKSTLDFFVRRNKIVKRDAFDGLVKLVTENLDSVNGIFVDKDDLLRSSGMVVVYYALFSRLRRDGVPVQFGRSQIIEFNELVAKNRRKFAAEADDVDFRLIEFEHLAQSSNDGSAIRERYEVLRSHLAPQTSA